MLKVNITLWMVAIEQKLRETTNPDHRAILRDLYGEFALRLHACE